MLTRLNHRFKFVQATGFTLMELMITLVVMSILVGIAYPSYTEQVRKGRRADAQGAMLERVQDLERWNTNNSTYATYTLAQDPRISAYYTLSATLAATTFTITATPVSTSDQAIDRCGTMSITNAGVKTVSTSATTCWP